MRRNFTASSIRRILADVINWHFFAVRSGVSNVDRFCGVKIPVVATDLGLIGWSLSYAQTTIYLGAIHNYFITQRLW